MPTAYDALETFAYVMLIVGVFTIVFSHLSHFNPTE